MSEAMETTERDELDESAYQLWRATHPGEEWFDLEIDSQGAWLNRAGEFLAGYAAAQAVSLPDLTDISVPIFEAIKGLRVFDNGHERDLFQTEADRIAVRAATAVLAALSNPPEIPDSSRLSLSQVADAIRHHCTIPSELASPTSDQIIYAVADWVENPPEWVLAALSTQPAAGEVEWEYAVADPAHDFAYMVIAGKPTPGAKAMRRRPAGPWVAVQPEPAPELAELFPGTLAALDRLTIRPEGLTYVVCDWLLDPETNRHCEFDGDVKLDANRNWRCPGCGHHRWAPPAAQKGSDRG